MYLDDAIIPARDEKEGVERLRRVLEVATEHGLQFNWKKCQLLQRRIKFLGHVVERGTIKPSPGKTRALIHYPQRETIKQVQSFLGLAGYFRKFIRN